MSLAVSPWFGGMFFMNVNQVLVRLWARRGRKSDRMWFFSREGISCGEESSRDRGNVFRGVCCVLSEMILYGIVLGLGAWCLVSVVPARGC